MLGVCVLFFIVVQSTILPGVLERMLHRTAETAGFPVQTLEIRSVSWSHAVFSSVTLGRESEIKIDTLQMEYNLRDLLSGHIQALRISGALITLPWNQEIVHHAGRTLPSGAVLSALPCDNLFLSSSSLLFTRHDARFRIPFEANLHCQPNRLTLDLDAELLGGQATLSVTTSPEGKPQRLNASLRGVHPGLLPQPFLPPFLSSPLQGALNGTVQGVRKNDDWETGIDLNFRLAGTYRNMPFSFQPARMEFKGFINPQGIPQHIQIDLACENIQLAQWMLKNISATGHGDARDLAIQISGTGDTWNFDTAEARITDGLPLLKQLLLNQTDPGQPPHLRLVLNKFNSRLPAGAFYVEEAVYDADLTCRAAAPRLLNARLGIRNGQLIGKNVLLSGIQTTFHIEEHFPLTTRDTQQTFVERAEFGGIVLTNGTVTYQLENPESLFIDRCEWSWCGGRLSSRAFSIPFHAPEIKCTAFFENISLDELGRLLVGGQLQGTGHLFGRMPINLRLAPDLALSFGKGHLYAIPSFGMLSILDAGIVEETLIGLESKKERPKDISRNELVHQALREYHFQQIKINFSRRQGNGLSGHIQLRGNGPPPYELPVGLNIPFSVK
ncbi:MAG: YdbH domain-containing protein [Kiritimatiellae bacterium]|nr:YdbH domain-containing protein [Kiritimatiellia bacterium]